MAGAAPRPPLRPRSHSSRPAQPQPKGPRRLWDWGPPPGPPRGHPCSLLAPGGLYAVVPVTPPCPRGTHHTPRGTRLGHVGSIAVQPPRKGVGTGPPAHRPRVASSLRHTAHGDTGDNGNPPRGGGGCDAGAAVCPSTVIACHRMSQRCHHVPRCRHCVSPALCPCVSQHHHRVSPCRHCVSLALCVCLCHRVSPTVCPSAIPLCPALSPCVPSTTYPITTWLFPLPHEATEAPGS